jgi:NADH dehydrogenase FAD-containing subunit
VTRKHLVLAGGGHAQLDLLAALTRTPLQEWDVTLLVPNPMFCYSGMLPAVMAGTATVADSQIPVAQIAMQAGIRVREAVIIALSTSTKMITLSDGSTLKYDLLSLDVGSAISGANLPGAADLAFPMRPFLRAIDLLTTLDAHIAASHTNASVPIVVVGGGAAGVEIAFALRARIEARHRRANVTIVDALASDGLPMHGFAENSRRLAARALRARGIAVQCGNVTEVSRDHIVMNGANGTVTLPSVATAWVAGPAAHAWLKSSGLECDVRGYPLASQTLALNADASVFGGGDCVSLRYAPDTPKAGVFAVRMAPVLARNVIDAANGLPLTVTYTPQRDFLALLSTGDGRALLRWRGIALEARWAQMLKTRIDVGYLKRYRALANG